MTVWQKIESLGGAISGGAALVVAIVAIIQVQSNDAKIDNYMNKMVPLMEQLFDRKTLEKQAIGMKIIFQEENWNSISIQEIWETDYIKSLNLSEADFLLTIREGMSSGFIVEHRFRRDGSEEKEIRFSWDRAYRFVVQ